MLNVGASDKDGITERGFRGIGRLGGLAYAETVQFTTSALGESVKTVMICDCTKMHRLLQKSNTETSDIMETFRAISCIEEQPESPSQHYFEVQLRGVQQDLGLLDENEVTRYLSETAPVDFDSQQFSQSRKIRDFFANNKVPLTCYKILRGERRKPIYKLYSRSLNTGKQTRTKTKDYVRDVELFYKNASDGKPLYIGWLAITDFSGIISDERVQGIRFRKGNILVGDASTFAKFFPSEGHNANRMFAGEIHILHDELIPNSQRDDFEPNTLYSEMRKYLSSWAGDINKKYRRGTSEATSALRKLNDLNEKTKELESQINSGAITSDEKREQYADKLKKLHADYTVEEKKVRKALENSVFDSDRAETVTRILSQAKTETEKIPTLASKIINEDYATKNDLDSSYSRNERKLYQKIIAVIDSFFANDHRTAENLREKIKSELNTKKK